LLIQDVRKHGGVILGGHRESCLVCAFNSLLAVSFAEPLIVTCSAFIFIWASN
jgi:hypothetical protein